VSFKNNYAFNTENEQNTGPKNDNAMRKCPGHTFWVRVLAFILCKEDPPKLYKKIVNGIIQNMIKRLALEYGFFYEISETELP
jgi:hypothetical protein